MMRNPFNKYIKFDIFNVYFILIISLSYHILHIELFSMGVNSIEVLIALEQLFIFELFDCSLL